VIASRRLGRCLAGLLLLALVCGGPAAGDAAVTTAPRFDFEAPPRFTGEVALLRRVPPQRWASVMELVGLDHTGPVIHVLLVPEDHPLAARTPRWITGFAVAERDVVVLLPERVPSYPYDSLDSLFVHEVTQVLLSRAAGGAALPRWLHEGVALLAARDWRFADRERLLVGGVSGVPPSIAALERAFAGEGYAIDTAYAVAGALVRELLRRHGRGTVAAITREVRAGAEFPVAFEVATGDSVATFEGAFWRRFRLLYRWVPFLTSGAVLWMGVTALALVAIARRRARDAAIRRRWEEEERLLAAPPPPPDELVN
jgi:hypothetical protein